MSSLFYIFVSLTRVYRFYWPPPPTHRTSFLFCWFSLFSCFHFTDFCYLYYCLPSAHFEFILFIFFNFLFLSLVSWVGIYIIFLSLFCVVVVLFFRISVPSVGLEFPIPRSRVTCSSNWTSQVPPALTLWLWDLFSLLLKILNAIYFPLSTVVDASHNFNVIFSFSFTSVYILNFFSDFLFDSCLIRSVLFSVHVFNDVLLYFCYWFLVWFHYGQIPLWSFCVITILLNLLRFFNYLGYGILNIPWMLEKIFHFESRLRVKTAQMFSSVYFADSMRWVILLNGMTLSLGKYEKIYKEYLISSEGCESRCDLQVSGCNKILPIVDILG